MYSNIYSGVYLNVFDSYSEANAWIEDVTDKGKSDGIVSVFMMPGDFISDIGSNPKSYELSKSKHYNSIDGYVPRNNKLFTYPYNFLYVTNLDGNHAEFHYEYFSDSTCTFRLSGDFSCNPNVVLCPTNYKGVVANYDEKMVLGGFPQCSWNTDSFKAWLAQNSASLAVGTFSGVARSVAAMAKAPVSGAISLVTNVGSTMAQVYEHSIMPPQAKGGGGNTTMSAIKVKDFAFMHKHIQKQFAVIIDRYFHMFGYATNKVKVPNRSIRSKWNYVKTLGCNAYGSVPSDDMKKIKSIYDDGITFWKSGATVGKYTDDSGNLLNNDIIVG